MSLITDWNPKQAALKEAAAKADRFDEAIRLCLDMHGSVHSSGVSSAAAPTIFDELLRGLTDDDLRVMPRNIDCFRRRASIAWNVWHIARIEDITANILIMNGNQLMDEERLKNVGATITHTGNGMGDEEIRLFSQSVNTEALLDYREAVGKRTREIIKSLAPADMKRKMNPNSLQRILSEGGVTEKEDSVWLLKYWGGKTVAGILLMPITRHQIMHINDSAKLKETIIAANL